MVFTGGSLKNRKIGKEAEENNDSKNKDKHQDLKMVEEESHGLVNLGNTCYLNAALQCIGRCKSLQAIVSKTEVVNEKVSTITSHLRKVC